MAKPPEGYDNWNDYLENMPPLNMTPFDRYGYSGCTLEEWMRNIGKPISWDLIGKQITAKEERCEFLRFSPLYIRRQLHEPE